MFRLKAKFITMAWFLACLHKLGMNSGLIPDSMITATSYQNGKEPIHARAPVDPGEFQQLFVAFAVLLFLIQLTDHSYGLHS